MAIYKISDFVKNKEGQESFIEAFSMSPDRQLYFKGIMTTFDATETHKKLLRGYVKTGQIDGSVILEDMVEHIDSNYDILNINELSCVSFLVGVFVQKIMLDALSATDELLKQDCR